MWGVSLCKSTGNYQHNTTPNPKIKFEGFHVGIIAKQPKHMIFLYEFQFPDNLLKDSTRVVTALRKRLRSLREFDVNGGGDEKDVGVGLYVMADTTYGSCCIDEVGASHINADCVIHYGHTCFSP